MLDMWLLLGVCVLTVLKSVDGAALTQSQDVSAGPSCPDQAMERDAQDLLPLRKPGGSVAVMKTHSVIYKNINGEKEQYEQRKEEVQKNGEIVARVQQELDKSGLNPEPHVKTMLDIPARNLHKVIEHGPKRIDSNNEKIRRLNYNISGVNVKPNAGKPFSPQDMAEYVFWTGDEQGATSAIQEFLEEGFLSRNEAITFLEEIKQNLESLKQQFAGDLEKPKVQVVAQKNFKGLD